MDDMQLAEMGRYYDEYMAGNPKSPETQQAILIYKSIAREIYAAQSDELKQKFTFEGFVAAAITPEVLAYLRKNQSAHPTIMPERVTLK
jgi:hypothetical protein